MDELEMKKFEEESHAQMMKMSEAPKLIEKEEVDRNKSEWGNCNITVTPEVLEGLSQGKVLCINVMTEYTIFISLGQQIHYDEEV